MRPTLRVLIAPDKFKGTLSAARAAGAIARGVRAAAVRAGVPVEIDRCPVADGGEGTAEIIATAWGDENVRWEGATISGPLGEIRHARWAAGRNGQAVFDSASACGLVFVPEGRRNPALCTTRGVGELLGVISRGRAKGAVRVNQVLVALGGSATIDAGVGMAAALGWRFLDDAGRVLESPVGSVLAKVARAVPPAPERRVIPGDLRVRALCDVSTALLGPQGCAEAFGPQKGATPQQVRDLDEALRRFVDVVGVEPGESDGAAGGLAYALRVFFGATLERGADAVFDAQGVPARIARADLVFTGEGRLDHTSVQGKAVGGVLALAARSGVFALVIAGSVDADAPSIDGALGRVARCAGDAPPTDRADAERRVVSAAEEAFTRWLGARPAEGGGSMSC